MKRLIVLIVVLANAGGLTFYWRYTAAHPATDDSYLGAGIVTVTPQVSGTVAALNVVENPLVQKGELLFTIDTAALEAARDAALAQLDQASQAAGVTGANVAAAEAKLASAGATQSEARSWYERQIALYRVGNVSQAAKAQSGGAGPENAGVRAARANLTLAEINLAHATVAAPVSG